MPYDVRLTRRALGEIDQAFGWLAERSPAAAAAWHRRLSAAVLSLEEHPQRCPLAPENDWYAGGELRNLLSGKRRGVFRLLFEIRNDVVYVLRVRHSAQDLLGPEDLPPNRLG